MEATSIVQTSQLRPTNTSTRWHEQLTECVVSFPSIDSVTDEQFGTLLAGGAAIGQFCLIGDISASRLPMTMHAGALRCGEIVLEIQGCRISGMTRRDALGWWRSHGRHGHPVMLKTVRSTLLPHTLSEFLLCKYAKDSPEASLQQVIRNNVLVRTASCTTRSRRPEEQHGVDYWFVSATYFAELLASGALLECGQYEGNWYGIPVPPIELELELNHPVDAAGITLPLTDSHLQLLRSITKGTLSSSATTITNGRAPPSPNRLNGQPDRSATTTNGTDGLPFGWQRIDDAHYGTYYVDHLSQHTQYNRPPDTTIDSSRRREIVTLQIVKGPSGFGFKIATSRSDGRQRVKEVTDPQRCGLLRIGDILVAIEHHNVRAVTHAELVSLLQRYPLNACVSFTVERDIEVRVTVNVTKPDASVDVPRMFQSKSTQDLRDAHTEQLGGSLADGLDSAGLRTHAPRWLANGEHVGRDLLNVTPDFIPASLLLKRSPASQTNLVRVGSSNMSRSHVILDGTTTEPAWPQPQSPGARQSVATSSASGSLVVQQPIQAQRSPNAAPSSGSNGEIVYVTLSWSDAGFGFKVIGGAELLAPISIGFLEPSLATDGRLQIGDELLAINDVPTSGSTCASVVQLLNRIATQEQSLRLTVRRGYSVLRSPTRHGRPASESQQSSSTSSGYVSQSQSRPQPTDPVLVVLQKRGPNESFGFVMMTNLQEHQVRVDSVQPDSPASRCGLKAGDRILLVNGADVSKMTHDGVVSAIKQSGANIRLTILPAPVATSPIATISARGLVSTTTAALSASRDYQYLPALSPNNGFSDSIGGHQQSAAQRLPESDAGATAPMNNKMMFTVQLKRGARGFGFSIKGGYEYSTMPLQIFQIAKSGAADLDGRLRPDDEILQINEYRTENMTQKNAVELIHHCASSIQLVVRRTVS